MRGVATDIVHVKENRLDRPTFVLGEPDLEYRAEAYRQILGEKQVHVAIEPGQVTGGHIRVDTRGSMEHKQAIPSWQNGGAVVITDGPPAATLEQSQTMMASGGVLLARPSLYDHRYKLLRQQLKDGQIGKLVAVRIIRLLPEDCWLPDGVTLNYAFDALDAMWSLLGGVQRIMAREQRLKRSNPDTLFAIVVGKNAAIGYLELCACYPQGYCSERIEVVGREGILEYNSDVNRTLRLNTSSPAPGAQTIIRDTFRDAPLARMIADYIRMMSDQQAIKAHIASTGEPLRLLYRALASNNQNQPA
jgi:predicted dehydrogenase